MVRKMCTLVFTFRDLMRTVVMHRHYSDGRERCCVPRDGEITGETW